MKEKAFLPRMGDSPSGSLMRSLMRIMALMLLVAFPALRANAWNITASDITFSDHLQSDGYVDVSFPFYDYDGNNEALHQDWSSNIQVNGVPVVYMRSIESGSGWQKGSFMKLWAYRIDGKAAEVRVMTYRQGTEWSYRDTPITSLSAWSNTPSKTTAFEITPESNGTSWVRIRVWPNVSDLEKGGVKIKTVFHMNRESGTDVTLTKESSEFKFDKSAYTTFPALNWAPSKDKPGYFDVYFTPTNYRTYDTYQFDCGNSTSVTSSNKIVKKYMMSSTVRKVDMTYEIALSEYQKFSKTQTVKIKAYAYPKSLKVDVNDLTNVEISWDVSCDTTVTNHYTGDKWVVERADNAEFSNPTEVGRVSFDMKKRTYTLTEDVSALNLNGTYYYRVRRTAIDDWGWDSNVIKTCSKVISSKHQYIGSASARMNSTGDKAVITWDWTGSIWTTGSKVMLERTNTARSTSTTIEIPQDSVQARSYSDKLLTTCETYKYKIYVQPGSSSYSKQTAMDVNEVMGPDNKPIKLRTADMGSVTSIEASKGYYNDCVILEWTTDGRPIESFSISARVHGSGAKFKQVGQLTANPGSTTCTYKDNMCLPGIIYDYIVTTICHCGDDAYIIDSDPVIGFRTPTGNINGRVTYGSGQAVMGVEVCAVPEEGSEIGGKAYRFDGKEDSYLKIKDNTLMSGATAAATVQAWVKAEKGGTVVAKPGMYSLYVTENGKAAFSVGSQLVESKKPIVGNGANGFVHLTGAVNKDSILLYVNGVEEAFLSRSESALASSAETVLIGQDLTGVVDEVRLWSRCLSEKEIADDFDGYLVGNEKGLEAYYTFNYGIESEFFDISYHGTEYNRHDGEVKGGAAITDVVPSLDQLCYKDISDEDGSYAIRAIPYYSNGTSYTLIPSLGIHKFEPSKEMRFISSTSQNFTVNFTDVSSFPVSGVVYYENTNYPVEGCNFYVDGTICSKDGKLVASDAEGHFEISVPIGDHFIEVRMSNGSHTFANEGRYPADPDNLGTKYTFDRAMTGLTFFDNTLVNLSGRVTGGSIEGDKPLGFGLSKNTIGQVELMLQPSNTNYSLNVTRTENGNGLIDVALNDTLLDCSTAESCAGVINSHSWRGARVGEIDDTKKIYIRTDPATGEFSAMLPPLLYKLQSAKVVKTGASVLSDDAGLPEYDLTQPLITETDSVETADGEKLSYECHKRAMITYRSAPTFTVKQKDAVGDAFGIKEYTVSDKFGEVAIDDIYTVGDDGTVSYRFGAPLFVMGEPFEFQIEGYEAYLNPDNDESSKVPLEGVEVTVNNELSSSQAVYVEGDNAGSVAKGEANVLTLDENGSATYSWLGGPPSISESNNPNVPSYARTISITYDIDGRTYNWSGSGMYGIILGDLPTGNNFVTAGPDKVDMVLRDPPGSNSHTEWSKGKIEVTTRTLGAVFEADWSLKTTTMFGSKVETGFGVGVFAMQDSDVKDNMVLGLRAQENFEGNTTNRTTYTATSTISTSDDPQYVGSMGDVYIGRATNITFGKARHIGLARETSTSDIALTKSDVVTTGLNFGTVFNYSQCYIEGTLIPNLEAMIAQKLITVTPDETTSYVNNTAYPVYLTTHSPGDPDFGKPNYAGDDLKIALREGKSTIDGPNYWMIKPANADKDECFTDSVAWLINQIDAWKNAIAQNEKDKVEAFKKRDKYLSDNISFDSGAKRSFSEQNDDTDGWSVDQKIVASFIGNNSFGFALNGAGVLVEISTETGVGEHNIHEEETTETATFTYELADGDAGDAFTVDVLKSPAGWSPIFHTRAGQSSAPYEGEDVARYYEPNQHHVLSEATMQIEKPKVSVVQNVISDIPAGGAANFTLEMENESEVDFDVYYKLMMIDESNTNGATIKIDGQVLTEGRRIKIPAGQKVSKLLQLTQSDYSVLDYENIGIVLGSESQSDPTSMWEVIADTTFITAHFVPSSSDVSLHIDRPLLNSTYGDELTLRFDNFDRNFHQLKAFRVQYKRKGDADWTTAQEYVLKEEDVTSSNKLLPTGASVPFVYDMHSMNDDEYTFRILSAATYGTSEVTRSSNEITVVKDMARPQLISLPSPTDGILNVGDEIALTFNEDIRQGAIKANEANFIIRGKLNNAQVSHDGVFQSAGGEGARTSTALNLEGRPFAVGAWVKWTGAGSVFRHGTADKFFDISITAEGKLKATIAGNEYVSDNKVPQGKWCYLNVSYNCNADTPVLDAYAASDADEVNLFYGTSVAKYDGNGAITIGEHINAAIHEVTLWNNQRNWAVAKLGMYQTHAASTDGLIGYWRLDEGHGTMGEDKARSRHLAMPEGNNWSMENDNYALTLDGKSYAALDLTKTGTDDDQNYMLEFWFRADKQAADATIMHIQKESPKVDLELVATAASLNLNVNGEATVVTTDNVTDNAWHHFSLNVLKGLSGMATAYVDGVAKAQVSADKLPAIRTDKLVMGAHRSYVAQSDSYTYSQYFKGDIDEVRFWNATQTAALIRDNMYNKVDTETAGSLALYYPFEKRTVDSGNQSVITADLADHSATKGDNAIIGGTTSIVPTKSSLGLKAAPQLENVPYSFVASERKILIDITADQQLIEGCTLQMTVRDIQDMNGNNCNEIKWNAYVSQSQLAWGEGEVSVVKEGTNATSFDMAIVNTSGEMADWTISGMPSWLSASSESGSLMPLTQKTLTFTVDEATAIGRYEAVIGLSGANGVTANLVVNLLVTGERPNWSVNADDYENSMSIVARLVIGGSPSEDSDDIVAAFVDGECRGVGHPEYYSRYDSYMVMMNIYGNSDNGKKVTFRAFDASTGDVYPEIIASTEVTFGSDFLTGSPANPIVLTATDNLEQSIETRAGWNWISLYVESSDMSVGNVLKSVEGRAEIVKDKASMSNYDTDEDTGEAEWFGKLLKMSVGTMYKLNMNSPAALSVIGKRVDPQAADRAITIDEGNNWIGYSASYYLSPDEAFAGLNPENEDVVKSKESFAVFMDYEWVGPLKALEPGKGYLYKSQSKASKTFNYPKKSAAASKAPMKAPAAEGQACKYTTCPITKYEGNMNIVAQAWKDNQPIECEIAVFDSKGECRGSEFSMYDNNLVFLTVQGEGEGEPLTIRVVYNDNGTVCDQLIDQVVYFKNDAIIGKASKPMVIDLDGLTGIDGINADSDETEYYNLHGVKVSDKYKGLKISKGNKLITK